MDIILSPTKQMHTETSAKYYSLPQMLDRTQILLDSMKAMSPLELKQLWNCSDKLVIENLERLAAIDLYNNLGPALFSYDGIAMKYLSPQTLSQHSVSFLNDHLRILSGFYGILRPNDGICPYRLEMQSKLKTSVASDLYSFWGSSLRNNLGDDRTVIINLASKEYSDCIEKHLKPGDVFISCIFAQPSGSKLIQKGVYAKMARGAMVRYIAENSIDDPEGMKDFSAQGYKYDTYRSTYNSYVFVSSDPGKP